MKAAPQNESHHYVPQFYLRHWCAADEKMWIYPVDGRKEFRASPKNFAAENGLYDTSSVPHLAARNQESDLSRLEGLFDSRWPDIFNGITTPATKMNLARFVALMHLRHPRRKEQVQRVNALFRKMVELTGGKDLIRVRGVNGEEMKIRKTDIETFASDTPENTKAGFLTSMRNSVEDLAVVLGARKWGVIHTENGEPAFVTGDCPVVLHRGTCNRRTFGFGTPGTVVTFPITPSKMLRIADDFADDGLHYPLLQLGDLNDGTINAADRFVFSAKQF